MLTFQVELSPKHNFHTSILIEFQKKMIFRYGFGETNNLGSVSKKRLGTNF